MLNYFKRFQKVIINWRGAFAEFSPCPGFNAGNKKAQHIVKDLSLPIVEALSFIQEEIRHLSKGCNPSLRGAACYGIFQFGDDGMIDRLQNETHVSFLTYQEMKLNL